MRHREAGYSLLELLIVIVITSAILVPLTTFALRGMTSFQYVEAQSHTSTELSMLSDRIAKVVRGTTSVEDADPNSLIIYGYFSPQDTVIKKIRYFISGTTLQIGVTPPSGTAPSYTYLPADETVTTTRIDLAMESNSLFTYYDDVGNPLTGAFATSQVKQVGIYIAANPNTRAVPKPIALQTRITLRNLKTNL